MALKANGAGGWSAAAWHFSTRRTKCEHHEARDRFCLVHDVLPHVEEPLSKHFSKKQTFHHVGTNEEGK